MSSASPVSSDAPPKPMRKGTRSCAECRRRKIRCIYASNTHSVCKNCEAGGVSCTQQKRGQVIVKKNEGQAALQERVARLESLIQASALGSLAIGKESESPATISPRNTESHYTASHDSSKLTLESEPGTTPLEAGAADAIAPVTSLFDNDIWQRTGPEGVHGIDDSTSKPGAGSASQRLLDKHVRSRAALMKSVPEAELLHDILNAASSWWATWRPLGAIPYSRIESLDQYVARQLCSNNAASVGMALLCIATSLQQLDIHNSDDILRRLGRPPGELVQEYFDRVDRIIVNDSDYAGTREGIEVIMMLSKTMMELGIIKRSWLLCQRAITFAQLLGFHRHQPSHRAGTNSEAAERFQMWMLMCHKDTYLSMLLDLPYGFYDKALPISPVERGTGYSFHLDMLKLSVRAVDRCQAGLNLSNRITEDIQNDLDTAAIQMPLEFWDPPHTLARGLITRDDYLSQLTAQCWYHQIRVSVQMPLMIQSAQNPHLETHRIACLAASRDLLKTYRLMRTDSLSAFQTLGVIDYQAFICAALLIMGALGYGNSAALGHSERVDQDKSLVQEILEILRQTSKTPGNTTASHALQGLETLSSLAKGDCPKGARHLGPNPFVRVKVPYSGTITISPGNFIKNCSSSSSSPTTGTLNFTLEGNGSAHYLPGGNGVEGELMGEDNGVGFDVDMEMPSIDFDWSNVMNPNLDENWAWLSDLNMPL